MAAHAAKSMAGTVVDLEQTSDPARVMEAACRRLATDGRAVLRRLRVAEIIDGIDAVCRRWLDPAFPWRRQVIERVEDETGMARPVIAHGLDVELRNYSAEALNRALRSEFGNPEFLDGFRGNDASGLTSSARSLGVAAYWFSSTIPALPALEIIRGLLVKTPALGRLSRRETAFAPSFLASAAEHIPEIAGAVWLATWPPELPDCLEVIARECAVAVVYGGPETCAMLRRALAPSLEFIEHGHKVGITLLDLDDVSGSNLAQLAAACAVDILTFDQRACISPQIYLVREGTGSAESFSRSLARALEDLETNLHPSAATLDDAIGQHLAAKETRFRGGEAIPAGSGHVLVERDLKHGWPTGGGRLVRVIPVHDLVDAIVNIPIRHSLQNAAIRVPAGERERVIEALAEAGVSRITRPGKMAHAGMSWHHDGMACLARMARWTDIEE